RSMKQHSSPLRVDSDLYLSSPFISTEAQNPTEASVGFCVCASEGTWSQIFASQISRPRLADFSFGKVHCSVFQTLLCCKTEKPQRYRVGTNCFKRERRDLNPQPPA